jgi:hypothetical protein
MQRNAGTARSVERVGYREGQTLTTADLRAEQQYLIAMHRRHQIGAHVWGIVEGLVLEIDSTDGGLAVQQGMAVDGYGRELIVPARVLVSASVLNQLGDALSVWLLYGFKESSALLGGDGVCRVSRIEEAARLRLARDGTGIDPRAPREVPAADLQFTPDRLPPDDPLQEWPVFLGALRRSAGGSRYSVDLTGRPQVDLVGEVIVAPSGRARLQVGSELAGDVRRLSLWATGDSGAPIERFSVAADGTATVFGNAVFGADLHIADASPGETVRAAEFGAKSAPPQAAMAWSAYRTLVPAANGRLQQDQLRFEIGSPGNKGDPRNFAFSIGHEANTAFTPCLSVTADCTVTVHGGLTIGGQLVEGPVQPDPQDPRFQTAVVNTWTAGIATAAAQLNSVLATGLQVSIRPPLVTPDTPLGYSVVVANAGSGAITNIHVYATLAVDGTVLQQGEITLTRTVLGENESITAQQTTQIRVRAGGEADIAVTAIGLGPAGNPIQAFARAKLTSTILPAPG